MESSDQTSSPHPTGELDKRDLRRYLPYLALLLPVLLVLPGMFSFPYPTHGESDLAVSHYPNAIFLLDAIRDSGEIPLWSPAIMSGYPLFANPLAGLWYPPGWLALIFPLPFGFNLLVALHLVWGGLGMTWLLRREGLGKISALSGGVAFACLPKLYAHFGAGHLSLLYALPWTPWLLGASLNSWRPLRGDPQTSGPRQQAIVGACRYLLPGVILALIFLADVRAAAYAGVLWWAYVFTHNPVRNWLRVLGQLAGQTAFAFVLSSPLSLPLLEYTRLSTRAWLLADDILVYSLPPARLIWLLFPDFGGFHEYMLYPGAVVLVLALGGFASRSAKPGRLFWLGALLASLLFALGEYLPGMKWFVSLPRLDLLRVPSRTLFISGTALAALAAYGLDGLIVFPHRIDRRLLVRFLFALSTLLLALTIGMRQVIGILPPNLVWGAAAILLTCLLVGLLSCDSPPRKFIFLGLLLVAVADWSLVDRLAYTPRPVEQVLAQGAEAARFLADKPGRFRTYSPSYSLPQQTAASYELELADGVDPLQLTRYAGFMDHATGVPHLAYSVTIPPYISGSPWIDNKDYVPDANLLGLLGVRYVLAGYDLGAEHLSLVRQFGETRLYENSLACPIAWVQPESSPVGEDIWPVSSEDRQPNKIEIKATGPGMLVLSEIDYPGWRAWVDGVEVEVETAAGLLRSVRISPGEHMIVFRFMPASLYWGLTILIAGIILVPGFLWLFLMVKRIDISR